MHNSRIAIATDKPPRPRRVIPLSVRLLAGIIGLVVAITCWTIGMRCWRIHTIEQAGGNITFRSRPTWWRRSFEAYPWWPSGIGEVESVNLSHNNCVTPAVMRSVNGISEIRELKLGNSTIADEDLVRLTRLENLTVLGLSDTGITHV